MSNEKPTRSVASDEDVEHYRKMTRQEVDQLTGMERERARYHTGYSFGKTKVVLKPKKDGPKNYPFPASGCMHD